MAFKKAINVVGLLCTSLSCMIGSGWLFGAYYCAIDAGPAAIITWLIGGCLIIFIAITYSELSTMLPLAGGIARYTQFSHGTLTSFCVGWLAWLSCIAVAPTEVQAILQYASAYWPALIYQSGNTPLLTWTGISAASIMLFAFSYLNMKGISLLIKYNNLLTIWKIFVPILAVSTIMYTNFRFDNFHQYEGFMPYGIDGVFEAVSGIVIFSYLGFREATSLAAEVKNPQVAIPIAVIGSVLVCTLFYSLIQIAFIGALTPNMLAAGWNKLHFVGDVGPFAGITKALGISWLASIIYIDSVVNPTGSGLVYTATTARVNYGMSKQNYIPKWLQQLNQHGVPANALVFNFFISLILFLPLPKWHDLIKFQTTAMVLAYASGPISLICLREQLPQLNRPFKVPVAKVFALFTYTICNILAYWSGWTNIWKLLLGIILGIGLLLSYRLYHEKSLENLDAGNSLWLIPHLLCLSITSYLGNFKGGLNLIPHGWEYLIIAGYSVIIFYLAKYLQLPKENTKNCLSNAQAELA